MVEFNEKLILMVLDLMRQLSETPRCLGLRAPWSTVIPKMALFSKETPSEATSLLHFTNYMFNFDGLTINSTRETQ